MLRLLLLLEDELTDMLCVFHAASHFRGIVWSGKLLLHPHVGAGSSYEEFGAEGRMFKHHRAVTKFLYQTITALYGGVGYFCDLVAIVSVPAMACSGSHKIYNVDRICKVDECIADVAVVGKINAQIHEVVLAQACLVYNVFEHGLERVSIARRKDAK